MRLTIFLQSSTPTFTAVPAASLCSQLTGDYFPNHIQFVSTNLVWKFEQLPLGLRLRRRMGENLSQKSAGVLRGCYSQTLGTKPHFFFTKTCVNMSPTEGFGSWRIHWHLIRTENRIFASYEGLSNYCGLSDEVIVSNKVN